MRSRSGQLVPEPQDPKLQVAKRRLQLLQEWPGLDSSSHPVAELLEEAQDAERSGGGTPEGLGEALKLLDRARR